MKKLLALSISLVVFASFMGCGNLPSDKKDSSESKTTMQEESKKNLETNKSPSKEEDSKEEESSKANTLSKDEAKPKEGKSESTIKEESTPHYYCKKCKTEITKRENDNYKSHCEECVTCISCLKPSLSCLKARDNEGVKFTQMCDGCFDYLRERTILDNRAREEARKIEEREVKKAQEENEYYANCKYVCSKCGWNSGMSGQEYMYTHNKNGDSYTLDPKSDKCEKCGGQMVEK